MYARRVILTVVAGLLILASSHHAIADRQKAFTLDLSVGDLTFGFDAATDEWILSPMTDVSVDGKRVPQLNFPLSFRYEFDDGSHLYQDDHRAFRADQRHEVCTAKCDGDSIECTEKEDKKCPEIIITSMDHDAFIQGNCRLKPGAAGDHGYTSFGTCMCRYWAESWPIRKFRFDLPPGSRIIVEVDPRNVVAESDETNNTFVATVPMNPLRG